MELKSKEGYSAVIGNEMSRFCENEKKLQSPKDISYISPNSTPCLEYLSGVALIIKLNIPKKTL